MSIYRYSMSLPDPTFPSPFISPHFRSPSLSKEFEERILTLTLPAAENSVAFAGRRSPTAFSAPSINRSNINLSSKKPQGLWAKLGTLFKGCFGAR